jgi:hypothetical protein
MTDPKKRFDIVMVELYLCNNQRIHNNASNILEKYKNNRSCFEYTNNHQTYRFIWTNKHKFFYFALPNNVKPISKINPQMWCNISKGEISLFGYPSDLYLFEYLI